MLAATNYFSAKEISRTNSYPPRVVADRGPLVTILEESTWRAIDFHLAALVA